MSMWNLLFASFLDLFSGVGVTFCSWSPRAGFIVESSDVCSDVLSDADIPMSIILQPVGTAREDDQNLQLGKEMVEQI